MNYLYNEALALRIKGYSYNEINKRLGIAKSTLSSWFSDVKLSPNAISRLKKRVSAGTLNGLVRRNKEQTVLARNRASEIQSKARLEVRELTNNDLLLIGVALYWAEGYKRLKRVNGREITAHSVSLTNSDPEIVSSFIQFLCKSLGVDREKIVIEMRLFEHIDANKAIEYWSHITGLSRSQFRKPLYPVSSASKGKRPKNRLPYGTVQVIVSDTKLFHRLLGLIQGLKDKLKDMV